MVPIKIGTWSGSINMVAMPLDDFQVILRMKFMHMMKLVHMLFLHSLCLMGGNDPYVIFVFQGGTKSI